MLKKTLIFPILFLGVASFAFCQQKGSNEVYGQILFSINKPNIVRGSGYNKDGTKAMHSDDPMARPEKNIIVSCHPLSFEVELPSTPNAYVTQKEQTFIPMVLPVTVGTTVYFVNEDQFFHNVYSNTPRSRFNIGRRPPGNSYGQKIKTTGVIQLSCDIHTHMNGLVLSLDTPYFTRTNEKGQFILSNLPDGQYRLQVFHPHYPAGLSEIIELKGGKSLNKSINLDKP